LNVCCSNSTCNLVVPSGPPCNTLLLAPPPSSHTQIPESEFASVKELILSLIGASSRSGQPAIYGIVAAAEAERLRPLTAAQLAAAGQSNEKVMMGGSGAVWLWMDLGVRVYVRVSHWCDGGRRCACHHRQLAMPCVILGVCGPALVSLAIKLYFTHTHITCPAHTPPNPPSCLLHHHTTPHRLLSRLQTWS
jgi:hypothetical protein